MRVGIQHDENKIKCDVLWPFKVFMEGTFSLYVMLCLINHMQCTVSQ